MIEPGLDLTLAVALAWLAWRVQRVPELYTAVVLYIAFGLVMAMVWVRLAAPDIALAEAAVGAGLTGALLLDAARSLPGISPVQPGDAKGVADRGAASGAVPTAVLVGLVGLIVLVAVIDIDVAASRLAYPVRGALPEAGVRHPVTAVLLNFRSFDTWLEVTVLLAALLAALAVGRSESLAAPARAGSREGVMEMVARTLPAVLVLVAAYLLWLGTSASGGAFQSGAVLGAAGIVLFLAGRSSVDALRIHPLRVAGAAGVIGFGAAAAWTLVARGHLLAFPRDGSAATVITAIEAGVALSVGVTLAALFVAARPAGVASHSTSAEDPR